MWTVGFQKHSEKFDTIALYLGKLGFGARGFVWSCVGGVAVSSAFTGHKTEGTSGALEIVADTNGGVVVLILATIGLLAYMLWRFFEGFYGLKYREGMSKFGVVVNCYITPLCSGIAYLIFAITNCITIRDGIKKDDDNEESVSTRMAQYTIGQVCFVLAGVLLIGAALVWVKDVLTGKIKKDFDMKRVERATVPKIIFLSCAYLGTVGRAILFILLSVLLIRVGFDNSIKSGGFGEALGQLQRNVAGRIFLVCLGVMLVIFGAYSVQMCHYKQFLDYRPHMVSQETKDRMKRRILDDDEDKVNNEVPQTGIQAV